MIKSKAIDIISSLDRGEFKEFGKFIRSPYFNENKRLVDLYNLLKTHYPDFSKRSFTKEILYKKLFGSKAYNDGTMRKLLSQFQGAAEEYITYSGIENTGPFQKKLALLHSFDEKKLDKLFSINFKELNVIYKKPANLDDDYFKNNFELEVAGINFTLGKGLSGIDPGRVLEDLLRCTTYLICYSLITIFKLNQDIMVTSISHDFNYKDTIAYKFIDSLGPQKFIESLKIYAPDFYPVISIYFNRFMISSGQDEGNAYYRKLKELVLKNIKLFSRFEKYNLMLFLENSCDEKILAGKEFKSELFNVHRKMLSSGLYTSEEKDYLSIVRFRKIVLNALSVNEFEWTVKFVKKYLGKLPEEYRDMMYFYSQSMLHFKKKEFDKALENISKVKFEVYSIKFDAWGITLKSEFELGDYERAAYSLDSYKHSLISDRASPKWIKIRFQNFMNYFGRILKKQEIEAGFTKPEIESMQKEISGISEIADKNWLLGKLSVMAV